MGVDVTFSGKIILGQTKSQADDIKGETVNSIKIVRRTLDCFQLAPCELGHTANRCLDRPAVRWEHG